MRLSSLTTTTVLLVFSLAGIAMAMPFSDTEAAVDWLLRPASKDASYAEQSTRRVAGLRDGVEKDLVRRGGYSSDTDPGGYVSDYFGKAWSRGSDSSHRLSTPTESTGTPFSTESSGSDSNDSRGRGLVRNRFARVIRHGTPPPVSSPEPDWSKKRVPPAHKKQQRRLKAMLAEPVSGSGNKQGLRGQRPSPLKIPGKPRPRSGGKKLYEFLNLGNPDDWKKPDPPPKRPFQNLNLHGIPGSPPPRAWEPPPQKKKGVASKVGRIAKKGMGKLTKGFKKLFGKRSVDGVEQRPAPGGGFFFRRTQAAAEPRFTNGPQFFKSQTTSNPQGRYSTPPLPPTAPKRFPELEAGPSATRHRKPPRAKKSRGVVHQAKKMLKKIFFFM